MKRRDFLGLLGATLVSTPNVSFGQTPATKARTTPLRIVVVANTYYEGDGLMTVLCNRWARNPKLEVPADMRWPRAVADVNANPMVEVDPKPRCRIKVQAQTGTATAIVEIWCLDDLMDKALNHGFSDNKEGAMSAIKIYAHPGEAVVEPDGVVAFGTAGFPDTISYDGCVTVGGSIFIRDASSDGPGEHSSWSWKDHMAIIVPSKAPSTFFSSVLADSQTLTTISSEMLTVPNNPGVKPRLIIASDGVAVSSVNIPKGTSYNTVDDKTVGVAKQAGATNITSVETTHGVIRAQWPDAPFIYVTAIPNRIDHFSDEASGNYAQEFTSTHNAGIAFNHIVPYFAAALSGG